MAEHFGKLKQHIEGLEKDFEAFYEKGNKAAGTRIRKSMNDLKAMAAEIRKDVQDRKNNEKGDNA